MSDLKDSLLDSFAKSGAIPKNHITIGFSNLISQNKQYASLFTHKCLPADGWSDFQIQSLLMLLSSLDTNHNETSHHTSDNDGPKKWNAKWCGVGEREGRVYSNLVSSRHFGLSHGVGRSGDITEAQPKAVGSSILANLTKCLVLDAMRRVCGMNAKSGGGKGGPASSCIVLPLCTGMSMSLVLASIRNSLSPDEIERRRVVLWSRIDQKSCYKAILTSGLQCVVVPTKVDDGDQVVTDLEAMAGYLKEYAGRVMAVISTTSCFAPRVPDSVDEIAKLCEKNDVAHIINNAYGLQCRHTCKLINRACTIGRVDAMVCSTDKNFMVPVGGAIVTSPSPAVIKNVGRVYSGRASSAPIQDLFITLLSMGVSGYKSLLNSRQQLIKRFQDSFSDIAIKYGERLLACPMNTISFGMTLDKLSVITEEHGEDIDESKMLRKKAERISLLGSMLFTRCVSGTRVVPRHQTKTLEGVEFVGFGSSTNNFPHYYLTAACAIGLSNEEMNCFFQRLDKCLKDFVKKH